MSIKLEVGKKYVVRDPEATGIKYVRVDAIRPEEKLGYRQVAATVLQLDGYMYSSDYAINGLFEHGHLRSIDLVAEYKEPELKLGPEHIGRRVKHRNGSVALITFYENDGTTGNVASSASTRHNTDGTYYYNYDLISEWDIVEILDN